MYLLLLHPGCIDFLPKNAFIVSDISGFISPNLDYLISWPPEPGTGVE